MCASSVTPWHSGARPGRHPLAYASVPTLQVPPATAAHSSCPARAPVVSWPMLSLPAVLPCPASPTASHTPQCCPHRRPNRTPHPLTRHRMYHIRNLAPAPSHPPSAARRNSPYLHRPTVSPICGPAPPVVPRVVFPFGAGKEFAADHLDRLLGKSILNRFFHQCCMAQHRHTRGANQPQDSSEWRRPQAQRHRDNEQSSVQL